MKRDLKQRSLKINAIHGQIRQTAGGLGSAQPGVCDQTWAAGSVHRCNSWEGRFNLEKSMMSWVEYSSPASCCHLHQLSVVRHTSSLILHICADKQLGRSNQVKSWPVRRSTSLTTSAHHHHHHPRRTGRGAHPIDSVYLRPLTYLQPAAGLLFPTKRTHTQRRSGSTAVFKRQSAQLFEPGRPYGDHITATLLPARLGASGNGQPALSLCARGPRNGAARRCRASSPADQSERRTQDARMTRSHGTGEILQLR